LGKFILQINMHDSASTAILFFSRTATEEAAAKTFDPQIGTKGNEAIASRLIEQGLAISQKTPFPVFTCFSPNQKGQTFGERLANAVEPVFQKGFQKVIAIGNDCPTLTASSLLQANRQLDQKSLVLGPANDGGVYLIGISSDAYSRKAFINLPWETSQLQDGWKSYASSQQAIISWLESQQDIDVPADFNNVLNKLHSSSRLKRQLLHIIASYKPNFLWVTTSFCTNFHKRNLSLRAPPF